MLAAFLAVLAAVLWFAGQDTASEHDVRPGGATATVAVAGGSQAEVTKSQVHFSADARVDAAAVAPATPIAAVAPDQVVVRFAEWTQQYLQAAPKERAILLNEGIALAQQRRPVFKEMIKGDPRQALADAVPMVVRQQLPQSVVNFIEERVSGRAVLRVYQSTPQPGEDAAGTTRIAEFQNGKTFSAYVYGRRAEKVTWTPDASLNGVAVDSQLAVSSDPLRVLEVGEIPNPAKPAVTVCPVSGLKTAAPENAGGAITEVTPAVEVFGEIVYLCDGSHVTLHRQTLI